MHSRAFRLSLCSARQACSLGQATTMACSNNEKWTWAQTHSEATNTEEGQTQASWHTSNYQEQTRQKPAEIGSDETLQSEETSQSGKALNFKGAWNHQVQAWQVPPELWLEESWQSESASKSTVASSWSPEAASPYNETSQSQGASLSGKTSWPQGTWEDREASWSEGAWQNKNGWWSGEAASQSEKAESVSSTDQAGCSSKRQTETSNWTQWKPEKPSRACPSPGPAVEPEAPTRACSSPESEVRTWVHGVPCRQAGQGFFHEELRKFRDTNDWCADSWMHILQLGKLNQFCYMLKPSVYRALYPGLCQIMF